MWKEIDNQLKRNFQFKDFIQAFAFMTEVAFHAEQQGHHPNWSNVYDWLLAQTIDEIYTNYQHR